MDSSPTTVASSDAQRLGILAQDAARHAAELLRAEFALAKDEFRDDLQNAKKRALSLALGAILLEVATTLLALGVVLLLGVTATVVFTTGIALAALALIFSFYGIHAVQSHALANTQKRIYSDAQSVVRSTNEY
jgi:type III secretory pathway component EscU